MFEPLQKFIGGAAKYYGIGTEVRAAKICNDFKMLVPELFKERENPERYIKAAYFKQNVLVINVENQGWAQEVMIRKHKIIEEMNKKEGKEIIKNLRAQLIR